VCSAADTLLYYLIYILFCLGLAHNYFIWYKGEDRSRPDDYLDSEINLCCIVCSKYTSKYNIKNSKKNWTACKPSVVIEKIILFLCVQHYINHNVKIVAVSMLILLMWNWNLVFFVKLGNWQYFVLDYIIGIICITYLLMSDKKYTMYIK